MNFFLFELQLSFVMVNRTTGTERGTANGPKASCLIIEEVADKGQTVSCCVKLVGTQQLQDRHSFNRTQVTKVLQVRKGESRTLPLVGQSGYFPSWLYQRDQLYKGVSSRGLVSNTVAVKAAKSKTTVERV
jgi:hypothetical protein